MFGPVGQVLLYKMNIDNPNFKFDGRGDFLRFKTKIIAFGTLKGGFHKAFTTQMNASVPAELAIMEEAWSYLMIALDGQALNLV